MEKIDNVLKVEVFELSTKFNDISTKGRARIFYRGKNRNGTYISEEFADKLVATVPYTPIKGIWNEELGDYEDHGISRVQGRIYGVVLAEPNFAWQDFVDPDGEVRTYACVDVIIYTAIYPEASQIVGKSLSMELLPKSIKGNWTLIDDMRYFEFEDAAFAGLQVLGEDVEPCFEGAQFFSLFNEMQELYAKIKEFSLETGGKEVMPVINFKRSDIEGFESIWQSLNPNYTEEAGWEVSYAVCSISENYALCYNYETLAFEKVMFSKSEEGIEIGERVNVYSYDGSKETIDSINSFIENYGSDFSKIAEDFEAMKSANAELNASLEAKNAEIETYTAKVAELTEREATYQASVEELNGKLEIANNSLNEVNASLEGAQTELDALKDYKHNIETEEKNSVIAKFAAKLDDEVISTYSANIDNYTKEALEKELSYELVKATPSIFSLEGNEPMLLKDTPATGIAAILEKYK